MKERPIIFSTPMVKAILEGRKTQTRRVVKPHPPADCTVWSGWIVESSCRKEEGMASWHENDISLVRKSHRVRCPYGKLGDRLWVRESFGYDNVDYVENYKKEPGMGSPCSGNAKVHYRASEKDISIFPKGYWKPSIHMPRWASRISLEITTIKVERLQDISEEDAKAEGCESIIVETIVPGRHGPFRRESYRQCFASLWGEIHDYGSWGLNPWVWVIEFKALEAK